MNNLYVLILLTVSLANNNYAQNHNANRVKVMTLGVFHFAYPNLDVVKTSKENQISVLNEPYQSEIKAIASVIELYNPTIIAIEAQPSKQLQIDSLYFKYKEGKHILSRDERQQLGFRIGEKLKIQTLHCVDDWGAHYEAVTEAFRDSIRVQQLIEYQRVAKKSTQAEKINSIILELIRLNEPLTVKESLAQYLDGIFLYEEKPSDFFGVDFQTGRWFNRNLRIFRNIQRIPKSSNDRILLIMGADHLNLLNHFFDVSNDFELELPLPYLLKAQENYKGQNQ